MFVSLHLFFYFGTTDDISNHGAIEERTLLMATEIECREPHVPNGKFFRCF